MRYAGYSSFKHNEQPKIGVLVTNLGTPVAPTTKALRVYLAEFLSDPRVIEVPKLIWMFVLHGVILRIRPSKSAQAYARVWEDTGSPLLTHTKNQANSLSQVLEQSYGQHVLVDYAMRYGSPSIGEQMEAFQRAGVRRLLLLPLYPQYSAVTTGSSFDALAHDFNRRRWLPDLRMISHYHDHSGYIDALVASITDHQKVNGVPQKLVFSYHGLPESCLEQGDPYHCECHKTTRLVAERLGLSKDAYITTFQSKVGPKEWLKPYTDETMKSLPSMGVKSVQVICPGFSADCLETVDEIDEENREYFECAGGEKFSYIPALNDSKKHIEFLAGLIADNLQGWAMPSSNAGENMYAHYQDRPERSDA